jgi:hypothetical protein
LYRSEPLLRSFSRDTSERGGGIKVDLVNISTPNQHGSSHGTPNPLLHQTSMEGVHVGGAVTSANDHYATLNADYLKRRYRRRHENPEKMAQLMSEYGRILGNLNTAIEGTMDVAAVGLLHEILVSLDSDNNTNVDTSQGKSTMDSGDRQRALYKSGMCPIIVNCLKDMGGQANVCEKALTCIAYLCRYSDENKSSSCLENAKAFGVLGIAELICGAIKLHKNDKKILEAALDAIRSLCALESNRERLGVAGLAEVVARDLTAYSNDPNIICWVCRAIGEFFLFFSRSSLLFRSLLSFLSSSHRSFGK